MRPRTPPNLFAAVAADRAFPAAVAELGLGDITRMAITERLAHLASLDIQRRFIIHATRDEYLLPEELLEDASAVVRQIRMQPQTISAPAVAAILALQPLLDAVVLPPDRNGLHHLVEDDSAWRAAREQAARCLDILGFDLVAWERAYR